MNEWGSWSLDVATAGWIAWMVFFVVWEAVGIATPIRGDTLTEHLRPIFQAQSLTWFLTFGLWLWVGFHFLLEVGTPFSR